MFVWYIVTRLILTAMVPCYACIYNALLYMHPERERERERESICMYTYMYSCSRLHCLALLLQSMDSGGELEGECVLAEESMTMNVSITIINSS